MAWLPPAATAALTFSSTPARLSHARARSASVWRDVSQGSRRVKVRKNGSVSSMTQASPLTTMHAALSSVNFGSNAKPSFEKHCMDRATISSVACRDLADRVPV